MVHFSEDRSGLLQAGKVALVSLGGNWRLTASDTVEPALAWIRLAVGNGAVVAQPEKMLEVRRSSKWNAICSSVGRATLVGDLLWRFDGIAGHVNRPCHHFFAAYEFNQVDRNKRVVAFAREGMHVRRKWAARRRF